MHSFICLWSLLLLTLSTDGLNLPPGWWCGDKPCPARITETRDSHMDNTSAAGITVSNTANSRFHIHGPVVQPSKWWCGTHPCGATTKERRDTRIQNTAVANTTITNTTKPTTVPNNDPKMTWWCGIRPCPGRRKRTKEIDTHNTAVANITVDDKTINHNVSWICGQKVCRPPRNSKMIKNRWINDTALNNTMTNATASNKAGHRRIKPAIVWWCNTHVCPSSMKTAEKRETVPLASEGSISS